VSALERAHDELVARLQRAERAEDWPECSILDPLADVADYVKRIGDHPESAHYRADKAGELVWWAVRVQHAAHEAYAPGDDATGEAIEHTTKALRAAGEAVNAALWLISRNGGRAAVSTDRRVGAAEALGHAVELAWARIDGEEDGR
jgi:hypothetical protein